MKAVMTKAHGNFKVGDRIEVTPQQFAVLAENESAITLAEHEAREEVKARDKQKQEELEARVDAVIATARGEGRLLPKEDAAPVKASALAMERTLPGAGLDYIRGLPKKVVDALTSRVTTSADPAKGHELTVMDDGLRETVKGFLVADKPWAVERGKEAGGRGLLVKANNDTTKLQQAVRMSHERSRLCAKIGDMIVHGADLTEDQMSSIIRAADYPDPAANHPLGVLNVGLMLQWNLGFLANQLAPLDDISTNMTGQPVLFNEMARTRYIKIYGVQKKTTSTTWGQHTGVDVDVNVTMDTYIGQPISLNNMILAATPRQLFNEQRQPMLYSMGEYIFGKLLYTAFNGSTRYSNDATTTATITFNPNYTNPAGGKYFNINGGAQASLATFTADLPAAMDLAKFPGGDEPEGETVLQRFAWVHTTAYAAAARDTNFMLNMSIQQLRNQNVGGNPLLTGRFDRLGNISFRKSQLVNDQLVETSAKATDGSTDLYYMSPGDYTKATYIGVSGTRSALLFVSRVPLDYTKVLPDVPATAAIELVTEPRTGLTLMVLKYLDHSYETANMRVQLMFGTAIGDERQGMLLGQK